MTASRTAIQDFSTANDIYVNATVTAYKVDNGQKTNIKADLYANITGADKVANPQILDSHGKFRNPVYFEEAIILTVTGLGNTPDHDTGIIDLTGSGSGSGGSTGTPLTTEEVEDIVGAMVSGNTENQIDVDYDDADGTIDYDVHNQIESILIACSDETTDLTTGAAKTTFRMPYDFVLLEVRASVTSAPTGTDLVVDINEGGSSILGQAIIIEPGQKSSTFSGTQPTIVDDDLADDAEITIDIDQIGATGAGLKVTLIGSRV